MARVFLLTGLSGAGKTTLAQLVQKEANDYIILDGDEMRKGVNSDLGFSYEHRLENIRRCGELAKLLANQGKTVILAIIAPYESLRQKLAEIIGEDLRVVHVSCPLEVCIQRDPKKNYRKALAGHIKNYTGLEDIWEAPQAPHLIIDTNLTTCEEAAAGLLAFIKKESGARSAA